MQEPKPLLTILYISRSLAHIQQLNLLNKMDITNQDHIEKIYDEIIASNYDIDEFKLLSKSRAVTISQIKNHCLESNINSILDFSLGTGEALIDCKNIFPSANLYGIDISQKMIDIAQQKIAVSAFHDDAKNIDKYLESASINLALIHFMMAYIPPEVIIPKASQILASGGFCSIATSTYDSFKNLQRLAKLANLLKKISVFSLIPKNPIKPKAKKNKKVLQTLFEKHGFTIKEKIIYEQEVEFTDLYHLHRWGVDSGWLTPFLAHITQEKLDKMNFLAKYFFPLKDKFQTVIVLAQKV
ncbi:MAG: class I SAM-dependent methyltransferase [Cyanobacteria bacterium P01_F01_bin.143]